MCNYGLSTEIHSYNTECFLPLTGNFKWGKILFQLCSYINVFSPVNTLCFAVTATKSVPKPKSLLPFPTSPDNSLLSPAFLNCLMRQQVQTDKQTWIYHTLRRVSSFHCIATLTFLAFGYHSFAKWFKMCEHGGLGSFPRTLWHINH